MHFDVAAAAAAASSCTDTCRSADITVSVLRNADMIAAIGVAFILDLPPQLPTVFEDPLAARLHFFFVTIEDLALGNLFLCVVFQVAVIIPDAIESVTRFLSYLDLLHVAE